MRVEKSSIRNRVFVGDKGFAAISNRYHVRLEVHSPAHGEMGTPMAPAIGVKVEIEAALLRRG